MAKEGGLAAAAYIQEWQNVCGVLAELILCSGSFFGRGAHLCVSSLSD